MKACIKDTGFPMYNNYDSTKEMNLPRGEVTALKSCVGCKDVIIQKSAKDNSVVIVNRDSYVNKIKEILIDSGKFEKLSIPPGKEYNFIINQEKRRLDVLKPLRKKRLLTILYIISYPSYLKNTIYFF